jgi:hypothetical protein
MVLPHLFITFNPPKSPPPMDVLGGPKGTGGQEEESRLDWTPVPIREFDTFGSYRVN